MERQACLIKNVNGADFSVTESNNFLRLKGLALILLIIKLGNYQKQGFLLDQKQSSEILLEISFMPFLISSHEISSPELFGYVLSIAHKHTLSARASAVLQKYYL